MCHNYRHQVPDPNLPEVLWQCYFIVMNNSVYYKCTDAIHAIKMWNLTFIMTD